MADPPRAVAVATTSRGLLRFLSLAVFLVFAAAAVAGALVTRDVVHDQEQRLLRTKTRELASLVTSSMGGLSGSLKLLGVVYQPGAPALFNAVAAALVTGDVKSVGVAHEQGGTYVVDAVGGRNRAGTALDGALATIAARAVSTGKLASGLLPDSPDAQGTLARAVADRGRIMFLEAAVDPTKVFATPPDSPFRQLNTVVYVGTRPDAAAAVISTTGTRRLAGEVQRRTVRIGADPWTIVTTTKRPLVGSFAGVVPWIILGVGLTIAAIAAVLVEILVRRRAYALRLVDERTSELEAIHDELAAARNSAELARESAEAANRSKSEFLSRMSHELRTPLNAVLGFAQILELDEPTPIQQESIDQIIKGGRHLVELINELLDVSRIETGDLALSPEPVHLSELLAEMMSLLRPLADESGIQLRGGGDPSSDIHVFADRQRLKQVILNLLSNAVKYNHAGGTVTVAGEWHGEARARITVTDTGPGIRAEHHDLLFAPFERLGADQTGAEGTGMGLTVSRALAEAMGGTLGVESEVGAGSTFWIELPVVEGPVERFERLDTELAAPVTARSSEGVRHTIVHIEDNLANVRLMERIFAGRDDIEIVPAIQGRPGIDLAREHHPLVILLDLHLPDLSGDEVLRLLMDDPATSGIPVIIISADATKGQVERLLASGASAYLTKPFDVRELQRTVDDLITERAQSTR